MSEKIVQTAGRQKLGESRQRWHRSWPSSRALSVAPGDAHR